MPCTYRECVSLFTEELPWLKGEDLEWVMGRGVCGVSSAGRPPVGDLAAAGRGCVHAAQRNHRGGRGLAGRIIRARRLTRSRFGPR